MKRIVMKRRLDDVKAVVLYWIYAGRCTGIPVIPSSGENTLRAAETEAEDRDLEELGSWAVTEVSARQACH